MPVEVEAKVELAVPGALRDRLEDLGGHLQGVAEQRDTFYQHPTRDFAATDEALRLREEGGRLELTYKGPRRPGAVKGRREVDVAIAGDMPAVLEALDFRPAAVLSKRRETWSLGDLTVCIDDLGPLGMFAEVEAVVDEDGDDEATDEATDEAAAMIEQALQDLGLVGAQRYQSSYLELALAAGVAQTME